MIEERLKEAIQKALDELGVEASGIHLEHPSDLRHGDFSTNVAMQTGEKNPKEFAEKIVSHLITQKILEIEKVEIAGSGFINFTLSSKFFVGSLEEILSKEESFSKNDDLLGQKTIVEYTDPNPFKELHIGHLMSNAVGEALSRLIESSGAETKRVTYQGDVGLHVAKAIWGKQQKPDASWGDAYAHGAQKYDEFKDEIDALNKVIYEKSDPGINRLWEEGKKESIENFENIYAHLGSNFDNYFFESEAAPGGKKVVLSHKDIFVESEGATVFHAEEHDPKLHTRVFISSAGIPTYEAKELALAKIKHDWYPYDRSIVITANEQNAYFDVGLKAMELVYPNLAEKTEHISHGVLRLPSGKMSSRTGDVVSAHTIITEARDKVLKRMDDKDNAIAIQVAIAAVKYSILKQSPGKDIIFDFDQSLSLEGDSGPYLQYSLVRARSVLEKAKSEKIPTWRSDRQVGCVGEIERLLYRFPEVVLRAQQELAPQLLVTYLTQLASAFNTSYAKEKIVDTTDTESPYRIARTHAVATVLANGLNILAIPIPERM